MKENQICKMPMLIEQYWDQLILDNRPSGRDASQI